MSDQHVIGMFFIVVGGVFALGFLPMVIWNSYELIQVFRHPERPYYGRYSVPPPPRKR